MDSFPYALELEVPFPTARLASIAQRALTADPELSPLVRRTMSVAPAEPAPPDGLPPPPLLLLLLRTRYEAATHRMLRVAVNSFVDTLRLVAEVMETLDVDLVERRAAQPS